MSQLVSLASGELVTKLEQSLRILRAWEPEDGYWLAFSGGKDSVAIHRLAEIAGVKFDAHYGVCPDPPELARFIRREYPQVSWERAPHSFQWYVARKGLPGIRRRWCCEIFKEQGGRDRSFVVTGIRAEESPKRAKYGQVTVCRTSGTRLVHPIRDWTEGEVWEFIREERVPTCGLYAEGFRRIGCIPCPFDRHVQRSLDGWPRVWEVTRRAFRVWWETHEKTPLRTRFTGPDAYFDWWLKRDDPYPSLLGSDPEIGGLFV